MITPRTFLDAIRSIAPLDDPADFQRRIREDFQNVLQRGVKLFEPDQAKLLTGYSYGEFYDWDLYFENLHLSYFGISEYCFSNLKSFLRRQQRNGFIPRTLVQQRLTHQFKPFLAQTALLGSRQISAFAWLLEEVSNVPGCDAVTLSYYERIKKSLDYWFWFQDFDKNGLPVWNSSDHSGMDNQVSRAGEGNEFATEGVDLATYLYREFEALELIARRLDLHADVESFRQQKKQLADRMMKFFWDDADSFFYDRHERSGTSIRVKSVAGFLPLFIGIVPEDQAKRLIERHLLNPNEFWLKYPVAGYAKTEPDYTQKGTEGWCNWKGTTWMPTNYMIAHGLLRYGYRSEAIELAARTLDLVWKQNATTREYYNGETGAGLGLDPFWGWSTLGFFLPYEIATGYSPSTIEDTALPKFCPTLAGFRAAMHQE